MINRLSANNEILILHNAWATSPDGDDFNLKEFEDALYIGSYLDKNEMESNDYKKYEWTEIDAIEDEYEEEQEDFSSIDEDELTELKANIINNSGHLENTQRVADIEIGNLNKLEKTNQGKENWTVSDGYNLEEAVMVPFAGKEVLGLRITCINTNISGTLDFDIGKFKDELIDNEDNVYTLSFDLKQSSLFNLSAKIGTNAAINFGEIDVSSGNENLELTNEWIYCTSTAAISKTDLESSKLIFDISKMPQFTVIEIANLKIEEGALSTPYVKETKGEKGEKGDPGEIPADELKKIRNAEEVANEAKNKAKTVENEQKKSYRIKNLTENGIYHGRIIIDKKQLLFQPQWYAISFSTFSIIDFESCPYAIKLSYTTKNGHKKNVESKKILWSTPASMALVGTKYDLIASAEEAIKTFKRNNSTPHPNWTMDDVALFVNKLDSHYIIQEYPRMLNYSGRVGKDYDVYCIVNRTEQSDYRIEIASYYQNDKPGDKDNYVLSKTSTQKLFIEYDMDTTKVATATEFGETTTVSTENTTAIGNYNEDTSDDDAIVFGNGTKSSPQTAVSIKKTGDIVIPETMYAKNFKIGEENSSFTGILERVDTLENSIQHGKFKVSNQVANQVVKNKITFKKAFKQPPHIILSADTGVPHKVAVSSSNITNKDFILYCHRTNDTGTSIYWIAIGEY